MFDNYKDVVDIKDLCKMLGIGKNAAYILLKDNRIKSFKIGKKYKIPKKYIIDYIIKNSQVGA